MACRMLAFCQIVALVIATSISTAQAAVVGNTDYFASAEREQRIAEVSSVLLREDVQQRLVAMGVDPQNAVERISTLSSEELKLLSERMGEMPAGSGVLGVLGVLFVVLIVLEVVGVTNIFSKL